MSKKKPALPLVVVRLRPSPIVGADSPFSLIEDTLRARFLHLSDATEATCAGRSAFRISDEEYLLLNDVQSRDDVGICRIMFHDRWAQGSVRCTLAKPGERRVASPEGFGMRVSDETLQQLEL